MASIYKKILANKAPPHPPNKEATTLKSKSLQITLTSNNNNNKIIQWNSDT